MCSCTWRRGDLYNNIFSDLGPLLSLFGDQVTMQFLSQALGLADCIVIAMAPLGILTILVSAIRVGGQPWLKAVIGRASENLSTAEKDLLSSTSDETCELWTGKNVVRCQGSADICEFILLWPEGLTTDSCPAVQIKELDADGAIKQQILVEKELSRWNRLQRTVKDSITGFARTLRFENEKQPDHSKAERGLYSRRSSVATMTTKGIIYEKTPSPNMFLNRHDSVNRNEIYFVAVLSILLQLGVLVFYVFMTYHPHFKLRFQKGNKPALEYPVFLTVIGTVMLSTGLLVCAHVIQRKSEEHCYITPDGQNVQIIWLQQGKTVNDQKFEPFATFLRDERKAIVTSRRRLCKRRKNYMGEQHDLDEDDLRVKLHSETLLGTAIGVTGYIMQLIGLRGMHWIAALVQFVATIVMTALRTWLRREALIGLGSEQLTPKFELDWLAVSLGNVGSAPWFLNMKKPKSSEESNRQIFSWTIICCLAHQIHFWFLGKKENQSAREGKQFIPWTIVNGIAGQKEKYRPLEPIPVPDTARTMVDDTKETVIEDMRELTSASLSVATSSISTSETGSVTIPEMQSEIENISKAQNVMGIRQQLCQIVAWGGPASVWSSSLARTIEGTMDILFPPDSTSSKRYKWSIDVLHNTTKPSEVSLELERSDRGGWKINTNKINAALSLWLYSAENQKRLEAERQKRLKAEKNCAARLRNGGKQQKNDPENADPRQQAALRLIGPKDNESLPELIRNLEWWSPEGLSRVLAVEQLKGSHQKRNIKCLQIERPRVVGCNSSGSAHNDVEMTEWAWCHAEKYDEDSRYRSELSLPYEPEAQHPQEEYIMENVNLAVESNDSLEKLYAKDLLFAFMCAAAGALKKPIQGETEIQRTTVEGPSAWKYYKLRNKNMERLAQEFHRNDFGTISEAYSSIIVPSLAMMGKLPDSVPLLRLGIDKANEYEKSQDWQHATEMYLHLWNRTRVFEHNGGYIFTKTVTAMMGFLRRIEEDLELREEEGRATYQVEEVAESLKEKLMSGEGNLSPLLLSLIRLYSTQGRPWEWNYGETAMTSPDPLDFRLGKLHILAMNPDLDGLSRQYLMALPEEIFNMQDVCDWTPLHYAAAVGPEWIVSDILTIDGVDPDARDLRQWTPLHYACLQGRKEVVTELLASNALPTAQGVDGVTPMHCAVRSGNLDVVETLLKEAPGGKYPKLLDFNERSPVHWAAIEGNALVMGAFKTGFKAKDAEGWGSLHLATIHQQPEIIELLYDKKIPKEPTDKKGRTPLILAAEWGKYKAAKALVSMGADVDSKGNAKRAALYYAVLNEHNDIAKLLLDKGADITAGSGSGKTMLYTAASRCSAEMIKLLLNKIPGAINTTEKTLEYTPLAAAVNSGRARITKLFITHGADVSVKDKWRNNLLHIAVNSTNSQKMEETVKILLEAKLDPTTKNKDGKTPLTLAEEKLAELQKRKRSSSTEENRRLEKEKKSENSSSDCWYRRQPNMLLRKHKTMRGNQRKSNDFTKRSLEFVASSLYKVSSSPMLPYSPLVSGHCPLSLTLLNVASVSVDFQRHCK
ncbi:Ankyrin-3-like protein [Cladobotryum mycophilum]|uniref:Ankyrin-3-like protein n=1 Tax=Cladobotryum mycophilum TaxID=491253 RepID=A0ABR0SQX0_9HYPO